MVVWTILDHFGPVHFPTVLRSLPSLWGLPGVQIFNLDRKFQSTIDRLKFSIPKAAIEFFNPRALWARGSYSPRGRSRDLLETPSSEPELFSRIFFLSPPPCHPSKSSPFFFSAPFAPFSPSRSALFCRETSTGQSLERGSFRMDLSTKLEQEIPEICVKIWNQKRAET